MRINPYLSFNGDCREAFTFYAITLGGQIESLMTWGESPEPMPLTDADKPRVMHASLRIGQDQIMGADNTAQCPYKPLEGTQVVLNIDEPAEAERVFKALADRGQVRMPLEETFWAKRFGMVHDRFGVPWMINCMKPMP
jgi:PhnB protein